MFGRLVQPVLTASPPNTRKYTMGPQFLIFKLTILQQLVCLFQRRQQAMLVGLYFGGQVIARQWGTFCARPDGESYDIIAL